MFENEKQVYNLLEDEESKAIYLNKLLLNVTEDKTYVDEVLKIYAKELTKIINNREIVVYGFGLFGKLYKDMFEKFMPEVKIKAICDKRAEELNEIDGYKVIDLDTLVSNYSDCTIFITPIANVGREIYELLIEKGFTKDKLIHIHSYQYFDEFIKFSNDEVFVDAGCFACDTALIFRDNCPNYKKILAFEPDLNNYINCQNAINKENIKDIELYKCGLWDKKDVLHFVASADCSFLSDNGEVEVELNSLDNILNGEKATFIKMDIEGAELKALEGAKETIQKYKPKLAICIYHKPEDIVEIPLYIHSLNQNYKFYIRHYSPIEYETILYAIPN